GSFKSCATALCGLLAYDAFWVFKSEEVVGKNVMMSVATNQSFNGPFRLLFPRFDDVLNPLPLDAFEFSLLGLGDVAIPGLLVALMLRYDASRATDLRGRANAAADAASLSAYLIGLLVAISANLLTGEGQPALVYLVPVTLGVVAYTAINRGESDRIIEF
ncbi:predicted protein, partial [Ostreococcus lucimarinus CCE9901]